MQKPENPPAFPLAVDESFQFANEGMTLRDWFAGQVIAAMSARDTLDPGQATPYQRANLAYIEADAMLAVRSAA